MVDDIYVIGAGQSHYGKFYDRNTKSLVREAVGQALEQAGVASGDLQAAWVGSAAQGVLTGQEMIRGQVVLQPLGIDGVPITNVENACASASTAFNSAWIALKAGMYDCVLALGMEKMAFQAPELRRKALESFSAAVDVEGLERLREVQRANDQKLEQSGQQSAYGEGRPKSMFMDFYGAGARAHMKQYGTTQRQFAIVASKNHKHASLNEYAQYRNEMTPEQVLADNVVSYPLTRPMCAPVGDGAAAAILCTGAFLKRVAGARPIKVLASLLTAGSDRKVDGKSPGQRLIARAYEVAGCGPGDIDLAEVHDASAYGEITAVEALGFCPEGQGGPLAESGATSLGGEIPVNTSGGLESRGHPIGATGLAQITELVWQLRGECGARQVQGARIGLAQNAGGSMQGGSAAYTIHILGRAF